VWSADHTATGLSVGLARTHVRPHAHPPASCAAPHSRVWQNGMGISEGKIELYTAAAGVDPGVCLPVALDVGTGNPQLRSDPRYTGLRQARPPDDEYFAFTDEFMAAVRVRLATRRRRAPSLRRSRSGSLHAESGIGYGSPSA
jgi:hypothetical protein